MFKKKKCKKCGEKISEKFSYCPNCGYPLGISDKEEYGMFGKKDIGDPFEELSKNMLGGFGGKMFNKMISGTMKMLEKEMKKNLETQNTKIPKTNFELYINGKKINPKNIKVTKKEIPKKQETPQIQTSQFNESTIKKFSKLPKQEPKTNIRRLSNKVIYELEIPGITSIKDISITKLENSIEIKAISKKKAYKKIINIDLPITNYKLDNEKLILELSVKN